MRGATGFVVSAQLPLVVEGSYQARVVSAIGPDTATVNRLERRMS